MSDDEQQIRREVEAWMAATRAGKEGGRWKLARDANLLAGPAPGR